MNHAEVFSLILQRNQDFIVKAVDGLSDAESVLGLPGESNCMNWVLGHVALYRDVMLAGIRQPTFFPASQTKLYAARSQPITPESKSVRLNKLLKLLDKSHDALMVWLESNPKGLRKKTPEDIQPRKGVTVVEHFAELCWHESNHVGELHALRELSLVSLGKGWK